MRARTLVLVSSGAIVVGVGAAWLTHIRRLSDLIPGADPDPVERTYEPLAPTSPDRAAARPRSDAVAVASVPHDAVVSSVPFQRDPRKPGYDAAKLFKIMDDDVMGLFALEPRDEAWAQEREGDIKSLALPEFRDVDRNAEIEVECHTATCRVRVHSRKPFLTDALGDYPISCLANAAVPMWGPSGSDIETPYSDFYLIFGPDTRSRDGMLARTTRTCAKYRDEWRKEALR